MAYATNLQVSYSLKQVTQGISISANGCKLFSHRYSEIVPPQEVEILSNNAMVLYPDVVWGFYNTDDRPQNGARCLGTRIAPDDRYWPADCGSDVVNGSTKLVGIED